MNGIGPGGAGRRAIAALAVFLLAPALGLADMLPSPPPSPLPSPSAPGDILRQYEEIKATADRLGLETLLPDAQRPQTTPEMAAALEKGRRDVLGAIGAGPGEKRAERARFLVFASLSLPRGVIVRMLDEARARGDMEVLFRGVPEGDTLARFAERLVSTSSTEAVPLALDPVSFRDHGIDVVPSIVDRETGHVLFGTFFVERFAHHDAGETVDRVYEIAEPDLIEVMQARVAAIDWDARRQGALDRAWAARPKVRLGRAARRTRRLLDLSFVLTRDATAADGTRIARAGTRIDPARHVPFTPTLIVFDGTDAAEIAYAARIAAAAREPVLMTTDLGDDAGLEGLRDLSAVFDAPVYALDHALAERFELAVTPSIVQAGQGGVVLIEGWDQ